MKGFCYRLLNPFVVSELVYGDRTPSKQISIYTAERDRSRCKINFYTGNFISQYVQTLSLYIQEGIVYKAVKGKHTTNVQMHYNTWTDCASVAVSNFIRSSLRKTDQVSGSSSMGRQSENLLDIWRRRHDSLKHWTPLTEWKIVTSQKIESSSSTDRQLL